MPMETTLRRRTTAGFEDLAIIDCDVHPTPGAEFAAFLPERWRGYLEAVGRRNFPNRGVTTTSRKGAARLDAYPPGGGPPGSDPGFACEQLLDEFGITAALLNEITSLASGGMPVDFESAYATAVNLYLHDVWMPADPRWFASISVTPDDERAAVEEIARCTERSDRYVQVLTSSKTERPAGNPKYWPIYQAAVAHGLPIAMHVTSSRRHSWFGGGPTFYYEQHVGNPTHAEGIVSSMIFEGVFERFPDLKVALTELGWDWAVTYAWRLDATWRVLRTEVPHLDRKPSEYFRDHFWFSTQPCVEPANPADAPGVWEQFEEFGFAEKLMFSSDYPHWDMDSPFEAMPASLPQATKEQIFAGNASALYGLSVGVESAT